MTAPALELRDLRKVFGERVVLGGINFQVRHGEVVALLGKNGAGKTTILNCISGALIPSGGDIRFAGSSLLPESPLRRRFGILVDAVFFDYLTVEENLHGCLMASGVLDRGERERRISRMLELVGLSDRIKKKVRTFSFGMRQRLGLAQALMADHEVLLLDEPLVGLDPPGRELFKKILVDAAREEHKAVLFSSHELADVSEVCDRVVMIRGGEVVYDNPYSYDRGVTLRAARPLPPHRNGRVSADGREISFSSVQDFSAAIGSNLFDGNEIVDISVEVHELNRLFQG